MRIRLPSVPVRWALGIILFVLVFAWFTAPNPISTGDESDPFVGRWLVNGTDAFGTEYSGSLNIAAADDGYALEWIVTGALASGTAERVGEELLVDWSRVNPQPGVFPDVVGTARYRIDDDGSLVGTSTVFGEPAAGSELGEPVG
ncbi:MAG: hypothetical protein GY720_06120 [bacterium]|nr:hypothetical protein [bacterium]